MRTPHDDHQAYYDAKARRNQPVADMAVWAAIIVLFPCAWLALGAALLTHLFGG